MTINQLRQSLRASFQSNSTPTGGTKHILTDQNDAEVIESANQLHKRVNITSYNTLTRFHALDCWYGQSAFVGELTLVNASKSTSGAHLSGSDHSVPETVFERRKLGMLHALLELCQAHVRPSVRNRGHPGSLMGAGFSDAP